MHCSSGRLPPNRLEPKFPKNCIMPGAHHCFLHYFQRTFESRQGHLEQVVQATNRTYHRVLADSVEASQVQQSRGWTHSRPPPPIGLSSHAVGNSFAGQSRMMSPSVGSTRPLQLLVYRATAKLPRWQVQASYFIPFFIHQGGANSSHSTVWPTTVNSGMLHF